MATYTESGLSLDLPDGAHFRFADLAAYRRLCGQKLKEMDFAWLHAGHLWLLEIKDYTKLSDPLTRADLIPGETVDGKRSKPHRFEGLVGKVADSLMMLLATWASTPVGAELASQVPAAARQLLPLKLVIALDVLPGLLPFLGDIKTALNDELRGRLALAGRPAPAVTVLDYDRLLALPGIGASIRRTTAAGGA